MNTISIYLKPSGSVAELKKDFAMYVGSYQNKLIDVYVPKELLYTNQNGTFNNTIKIGGLLTAPNGEEITTDSYYLDFLKDTSIFDPVTNQSINYSVFEARLPKELTVYPGNQELVVNVLAIDTTIPNNPKLIQVVTSQVCNLNVENSAYIENLEELTPEIADYLYSKILENQTEINKIKTDYSMGEDYIGKEIGAELPTEEQLNQFVANNTVPSREPKNGDVVIFVLQVTGGTDKNYKYIYTNQGWDFYEIPPIEQANNGTLGLVTGTYTLPSVNDTLVDIQNGEIVGVYIYKNESYVNIRDAIIENSLNIADIQNAGATKQYVRDYAQPKEFNNAFYIDSTGYSDTVPTSPASGIQYSVNVNAVADYTLFNIQLDLEPGASFSQKNSYNENIYVEASNTIDAIFRLTTEIVRGSEIIPIDIVLSDPKTLVSGNVYNLAFRSVMSGLETTVVNTQAGDKLQQKLEVVTQSSTSSTINVYSNNIYPSFMQFNTQSVVVITATGNLGEQPVIESTGVLNGNVMTFELPSNTQFYNNTECLFKLTYYSLNIGDDVELQVILNGQNIHFYTPYNQNNGNVTMGDLNQVLYKLDNNDNVTLLIKGFVEIDSNDNITVYVSEDDLYEYLKTAELSSKVSNPNLLINGDFRINQRGASGTQSGNSRFPVDRWRTAALNAFCTTNLDTNGNVESVVAGITGVTAASGRVSLAYNFEDKDFNKLLGKQVTLSINYQELSADVTNSVRIRYDSGVDNGSKVLTETSGTAILTFTVNPNATKLVIQISGTSSALNYSLKLNWAKLELGSVATTFSPRPYAEELALCQRYYWKSASQLGSSYYGYSLSESNIRMIITMPIVMRTAPTISNLNVSDIAIIGAGLQMHPTAYTYQEYSSNGTVPQITYELTCQNESSYAYIIRLLQEFSLDAEIY